MEETAMGTETRWDFRNVDFLDHSDEEKQAVTDLKEEVDRRDGVVCVTRMASPTHDRTHPVEYWASASWVPSSWATPSPGPNVYLTDRAATPTMAAHGLLERIQAGAARHEW